MFRRIFKKLKSEKGQAVIELAITLPILILILGGIVDFGWLFTNKNTIDHLAREGARYAIVHSTGTDPKPGIVTYTKNLASYDIRSTVNVTVTFSNPTKPRNGDVTIVVQRNVNVLTPIVGVFTSNQAIPLSSSCTMKVE